MLTTGEDRDRKPDPKNINILDSRGQKLSNPNGTGTLPTKTTEIPPANPSIEAQNADIQQPQHSPALQQQQKA